PALLERRADQLVVARVEAAATATEGPEHAVVGSDGLRSEGAEREQLLAEIEEGTPVPGHLDAVVRRTDGLRGCGGLADLDRNARERATAAHAQEQRRR